MKHGRDWEGIVSLFVVLLVVAVGRLTRQPSLMMLADFLVYLCFAASIVWFCRALFRRFTR